MSMNKLYFNKVDFIKNPDGSVDVRPNLICPKCRTYVGGKIVKNDDVIYKTVSKIPVDSISKIVNINSKRTYIMPCCGTKIELYVAIHDSSLCISVEPIKTDWWKTSEI